MAVEIVEQNFLANGVRLNYAEIPSDGAALVLLHGGSARWQSFEHTMPLLAKHWHVYAPELRGHGKSVWTPGHYRLQDYADDVILFLKEVVKEPAFLFGHSLGGFVAVFVAAQYPQGVRAADPNAGAMLSNAEVASAKTLLTRSQHVQLKGIDHSLHHGGHDQVIVDVLESFFTPLEANSVQE